MSFNRYFQSIPTTIFEQMNHLAVQHKAVNLGQGFPEDNGNPKVREAAADVLLNGYNQYPPMLGTVALRQAVARHDKRFYGADVNGLTDVLVTAGAIEALASAVKALINEGDEVILFEPFFDAYEPLIIMSGGIPRYIPLKTPSWDIDFQALKQAINDKTKLVIFNNPLNPAGRVYSRQELQQLADILEPTNAYVIADEVYEHLVYDGQKHTSFLEIENMRNRTLKIGSAGKTFSLTGVRVGYVTACEDLIKITSKVHQFLTFAVSPSLQQGVAVALDQSDADYNELWQDLQTKRDYFCSGLRQAGFNVLPCQGTYFATIDLTGTKWENRDWDFAQWLVTEKGIASIPYYAFYGPETSQTSFVRFCFAKSQATLDEALKRLKTI